MSEELAEVLSNCLSARQSAIAKRAGDSLRLYLGGWLMNFARSAGKNREDAVEHLAHRLSPETLAELASKSGGGPVTLEQLLPALYQHTQEQLEKAFSRAVSDAISDLSTEVEEALRSVDRSLLSVAVPSALLEGAVASAISPANSKPPTQAVPPPQHAQKPPQPAQQQSAAYAPYQPQQQHNPAMSPSSAASSLPPLPPSLSHMGGLHGHHGHHQQHQHQQQQGGLMPAIELQPLPLPSAQAAALEAASAAYYGFGGGPTQQGGPPGGPPLNRADYSNILEQLALQTQGAQPPQSYHGMPSSSPAASSSASGFDRPGTAGSAFGASAGGLLSNTNSNGGGGRRGRSHSRERSSERKRSSPERGGRRGGRSRSRSPSRPRGNRRRGGGSRSRSHSRSRSRDGRRRSRSPSRSRRRGDSPPGGDPWRGGGMGGMPPVLPPLGPPLPLGGGPLPLGPDVSNERDGSTRSIRVITGYRVGYMGRNLELHVQWTDGCVGWHHPKQFTWGPHNYRPMLRYVSENMPAINADMHRGGFAQYVDSAGHMRELEPNERHPGAGGMGAGGGSGGGGEPVQAGPDVTALPEGVCWGFLRRGRCNLGDGCRFKHLSQADAERMQMKIPQQQEAGSGQSTTPTARGTDGSTPTSASAHNMGAPTPTAASTASGGGRPARARVIIEAVDDYRISDRDVLELHARWSDGSFTWQDSKVDWGTALATRNAFLQPRRNQINRELFKRGRLFYVKPDGQPARCSLATHPGKDLPDLPKIPNPGSEAPAAAEAQQQQAPAAEAAPPAQ